MVIPDLGPWADLDAFRLFLKCIMVKRAKESDLIQYEELENELLVRSDFRKNPQHRSFYFHELDILNQTEIEQNRFPLSVLVTKKNLGRPGDGFYSCIHKYGLLHQDPLTLTEQNKREIFGFWFSATVEYWNRHPFAHFSGSKFQIH